MTIAWAIVISTVLFILYKTGVLTSRRFWKWTGITCGSLALIYAGILAISWGQDAYEARKQAKAQAAEAAIEAAQQAANEKIWKDACTTWEHNHPIGSPPDRLPNGDIVTTPSPDCGTGPIESAYTANAIRVAQKEVAERQAKKRAQERAIEQAQAIANDQQCKSRVAVVLGRIGLANIPYTFHYAGACYYEVKTSDGALVVNNAFIEGADSYSNSGHYAWYTVIPRSVLGGGLACWVYPHGDSSVSSGSYEGITCSSRAEFDELVLKYFGLREPQ
jgi:hypothetical protein